MSRLHKTSHPLFPLPDKRRNVKIRTNFVKTNSREGMEITIGFSTTNNFLSRFIRWVTGGTVSHAWIAYFDITLNQRFVMQAEWYGFSLMPWPQWLKKNIWKAEFLIPNDPENYNALHDISDYLGSDYDYESAMTLTIRDWLKRWIKCPYKNPSSLMCSEAVVRFLGRTRLGTYAGLDPEMTSPKILLEKIKEDNRFVPLLNPIKLI